MRVECQYRSCSCTKHIGHTYEICGQCQHGACWHRLDTSQFKSSRAPARRALYYNIVSIPESMQLPEVPPLPELTPRYCTQVKRLPV
jgi:hypothetical protein